MTDLTKLPQYQCHERVRVRAVKIGRFDQCAAEGCFIVPDRFHPPSATVAAFKVSSSYIEKHRPKAGGYFVVHEDGCQSYSPSEAFESGYTLMDPNQSPHKTQAMLDIAAWLDMDTDRLEWLRTHVESQEFCETMSTRVPSSLDAFRTMIDELMRTS